MSRAVPRTMPTSVLNEIRSAARSERVKLVRPRLVLPVLLGTALLAALTAAAFTLLSDGPATGPLRPMGIASPVIGLVVMCVAANSFCDEYREGTWGALLVRHPRRSTLLVGKLGSLLALAAAAALAACLACAVTAWAVTAALGKDTASWSTAATASTGVRVVAGFLAYAVLGAAAGLLLRSTAAALGSLLGWILIGESALGAVAAARGLNASAWLPGSAITRITASAAWQLPALTATAWCAVLFAAAIWRFCRSPRLG
ncbi:ABC transporter permease [Streptomyces ferrugineus]|uniref:ABC transporter permease n=1 Tax=Streptomyces ferrugineus TaxID=1413221 RepID=A0A7M2SPS7_9ACTN|nr:ABC transporter permease [Streptomyces ferrugineus]QOV37735.1 ABC transporter permease [Streptomyces ferrugineus]